MTTPMERVGSRRAALDILDAARKRRGYSCHELSELAGYSENHFTHALHSGAISVQAVVDYLGALDMDLVVRGRE